MKTYICMHGHICYSLNDLKGLICVSSRWPGAIWMAFIKRIHEEILTWKRFSHHWWIQSKSVSKNDSKTESSMNRVYNSLRYCDVIMGVLASQITSLTIVYSTVYSDADQRKHQSSASLAFVWGIHRGPVNSPHKWPVTRKMFPFDDVIMYVMQHNELLSILQYAVLTYWYYVYF